MRYRSVSAEGPLNTTTVFTKEANLTGLIKDESYNVSVLATTIEGDGPYSVPKEFTTNEGGKYSSSLFCNFYRCAVCFQPLMNIACMQE